MTKENKIRSDLNRFLVIQTASLGDVILTTPVLEKLHHYYPDAKIDLLVKKGNEGLFENHPFLNELLVWDKKNGKYRNLVDMLKRIRKNGYDCVINFQRFASSGLITAFSGAKLKCGFDKNPWAPVFNIKVWHEIGKTGIHETKRNLKLIESLTGEKDFHVRLYPGEKDEARVSEYSDTPFICIAPASLWFTKQFPEEKWVEFIRRLPEDLRICFLGSAADAQLCDRIIERSGHNNSLNLAGELSFLESAALMKRSAMNFVNDSAPMHLASAVNAPVTAIFCSTVPEFGFGPLSDDSKVVEVAEELYCRPCGLHGYRSCPEGHFRCAHSISVERLVERIER